MIIKRLTRTALLVAVLLLPMAPSFAFESTASVGVTSNYIFRGVTQSSNKSAVQGSFFAEKSEDNGWYAGVFASTVSRGAEVDLFAGWKGRLGKESSLGYDVGVIKYTYTDNQFSPDIFELYFGINYESAYLKLYNGSGSGIDDYNYLDLGASFIALEDLDLQLHYGRTLNSVSSNDISAALAFELKKFDLNLGASYSDASSSSEDVKVFISIGKSFD